VYGLATEYGMEAVRIQDVGDPPEGLYGSTWMLVTNDSTWLDAPEIRDAVEASVATSPRAGGLRLWTDEYSNLFQLLRP